MKLCDQRSIWLIILIPFLFSCAVSPPPQVQPNKRYQVVLVHDLSNKYPWGEPFLSACLDIWGSGNVFAVYTSPSGPMRDRQIEGKTMYCGGADDSTSGIAFVEDQAEYMHRLIKNFQSNHALKPEFSIIAHGMGGLVSRCYIYKYPHTVSGLVTIGTPHHGSPLAKSMSWSGLYFGTAKALEDLRPKSAIKFNRRYPVTGAPLADNGKIYSIRGDADGWDVYGLSGELQLGWELLKIADFLDSDGMVPRNSAVIDGATHIADFWGYDHYELIQAPEVAQKAAQYLK